MKLILSLLLAVCCSASQALVIFAEETPDQFILVEQTEQGTLFRECAGSFMNSFACELMFDGKTFSKEALEDAAFNKKVHSGLAIVADVALVFGLIYTGGHLGLAKAHWFVNLGYGNGTAAIGPGFGGMVLGGASGVALDMTVDQLKPYVHGDLAISFYASAGTMRYDERDYVDGNATHLGLQIMIDDINFDQLKASYENQLN